MYSIFTLKLSTKLKFHFGIVWYDLENDFPEFLISSKMANWPVMRHATRHAIILLFDTFLL